MLYKEGLATTSVTWSGWQSLGGTSLSEVAALPSPQGDVDVFVVGTDQAVYRNHRDTVYGWTGWTRFGGVVHATYPRVSIGKGPSGKLYVFVVGTDNSVYYRRREQIEPEMWSEWRGLGGVARSTVVFGIDEVNFNAQIFVVGTDGQVYRRVLSNEALDAWSSWESLGGTATSNPMLVTSPWNSLLLFISGPNRELMYRDISSRSGWATWPQAPVF